MTNEPPPTTRTAISCAAASCHNATIRLEYTTHSEASARAAELRQRGVPCAVDLVCVLIELSAAMGPDVIADVREFYDAVMEHNPKAMMQDRDQHPPALIRPMTRQRLLQEERDEHHNAQLVGDLPGTLDGIVDQIVILVGTARIQFGEARLERALDAVHVSNMAKRFPDGTFHVLESGKIVKPPGWVEPDIAAIIEDRQP